MRRWKKAWRAIWHNGGEGSDNISAFSDDSLASETLLGGGGNDTFSNVGYRAADIVDAGSGDDVVSVYGHTTSTLSSTITLGAGQDTLVHAIFANFGDYMRLHATITDFETGASGDKVNVTSILNGLTNYAGSNPFSSGHLRLVQDGVDTLLQVDPGGSGDGSTWTTFYKFENTTSASFTADNFTPAWPPSVNVAPAASISATTFAATE